MRRFPLPFLICVYLLAGLQTVHAQAVTSRPCATDPVYRQFDFWLGDWEVFSAKGKAGESHVSIILDSCIILEEWTGTNGYSGKSFNTYNASTKQWQQTWVDNVGGSTAFLRGEASPGKIVFYADHVRDRQGHEFRRRLSFFDLGNGKVRQWGEKSMDGGKTWSTEYDLEYRKKK